MKETELKAKECNSNAAEEVALEDSERQPCEVWTRVMGYYRPTSFFNVGKQGEYAERVTFTEQKSCCCCQEQE